jgi:hypothetical protein
LTARITFLVHKGKEYTVKNYLRSWGRERAPVVEVRNYPGLHATGRSPWKRLEQSLRGWRLGTLNRLHEATGERRIVVFADIERLDSHETERALSLWEDVASHSDTALVLNHPTRSMRRFELLERLYTEGINTNPMILIPADLNDPLRGEANAVFGHAFNQMLRDLMDGVEATAPAG